VFQAGVRSEGTTVRVHQKWGFGMAPVKP
jgi:hypothetical protein